MVNNENKNILTDYFNYQLDENKIAKEPVKLRNLSKLLVYKNGKISEDIFKNVHNYIDGNSLLVFNNSKVLNARIIFYKPTGARIEVFCLEPYNPSEYNLNLLSKSSCKWKCLIGNSKKIKNGFLEKNIIINNFEITLKATIEKTMNENCIVEFNWSSEKVLFSEILDVAGEIPIPPYLNRDSNINDKKNYQTVYSKFKGSVAAPTAGLHFTNDDISKLISKNVTTDFLTLHVGAGTFKPLSTKFIGDHIMHAEQFFISLKTIQNLINFYPKITTVGTTSTRAIESLYIVGNLIDKNNKTNQFAVNQWDAYDNSLKTTPLFALQNIENHMQLNKIDTLKITTSLMIIPGYKFKYVNTLITNFHQPKSSLLALVAAFSGEHWKDIYSYAINNDFRFLSYGDSSILFR